VGREPYVVEVAADRTVVGAVRSWIARAMEVVTATSTSSTAGAARLLGPLPYISS